MTVKISFLNLITNYHQSKGEDNESKTKFELKIYLEEGTNDAKPKIKRLTNETYRLTVSYRYYVPMCQRLWNEVNW